jgi:hypothetical protein
MKIVVSAMFCTCWVTFCLGQGTQGPPDANPGRPTVSTPATLTPLGYLQFENGILGAGDSSEFDTRLGINQVTKLTVLPRLELFLQSEPLVRSRNVNDTELQPGEVFAGFQGVLLPGNDSRPTVSVSYTRRLYASPAPELDLGTFRQNGLLLVSFDLKGFHIDTNGVFSEQVEGTVHRMQYGQTLSISHPVGKLIVAGEIWHFSQPFMRSNALGSLWAISYPIRRNLVVDSGFDHGFTGTSTAWEGFFGFTYLLPRRLWKPH